MVNVLERSANRPTVIKSQIKIDTANFAQKSRVRYGPGVSKVRRPTAILVDRQPDSVLVSQIGKALGQVEIESQGFLTEHMFAGPECCFENLPAVLGMQGGVDYLDVIALQDFVEVGANRSGGIKFIASFSGSRQVDVANGGDFESELTIGSQMILGYTSRTQSGRSLAGSCLAIGEDTLAPARGPWPDAPACSSHSRRNHWPYDRGRL